MLAGVSSDPGPLVPPVGAVYDQNVPVDVVTRVAEEIHRGIGDVTDCTPASGRNVLSRLFIVKLGAAKTVHALGSFDAARGNHVGGDSVRPVFQSHGCTDRVHGRLGGCDVCLHGHSSVVERCRDINDAAAGETVPRVRVALCRLDEVGYRRLDGVIRPEDVNFHDGLEAFGGESRDRSDEIPCCSSTTS